MSQGYWQRHQWPGCRCCHSGPKEKFFCAACDHVINAPNGWTPRCPFCREPMANMGHKWKPGKKGKRDRYQQDVAPWRLPSPGLALLLRLEGKL